MHRIRLFFLHFAPWKALRVLCQLSYGGMKERSELYLTSGVGEYLSSRAVSSQVLSARQSLTSVFGMGTGGPSALITPTIGLCFPQSLVYHTSKLLSSPNLHLSSLHLIRYTLQQLVRVVGNETSFTNLFRSLSVSFNAPSGIRTRDPLIKSQLLYQLS